MDRQNFNRIGVNKDHQTSLRYLFKVEVALGCTQSKIASALLLGVGARDSNTYRRTQTS
jgi:hypothetical protein